MDDRSTTLWLVILILFGFAAYFALAETSFASVSRVRMKAASEMGDKRARCALKILDEFDRAVTTILIGTNITHLGIASIVTVMVIHSWGAAYVTLSTIVTTILVFFLSEMLPKSIAKRYCEPLALVTARPLMLFMKLFRPLSFVLTAIGQAAARRIGQEEEVTVTEEELHEIIEDMTDDGMLDEEQGELIASALEFGDIMVHSIFTPRDRMECISIDAKPEEVKAFLLAHEHSRYPVYEGSPDHIVGTLQMRKYLKTLRNQGVPELRDLIDQPLMVHRSAGVLDLIRMMNEKKVSLAIVRDDAENICGMITVEDALEELISDLGAEGGAGA